MALAAAATNHAGWTRWPQQIQEYGIMENPGLVPYDGRNASHNNSMARPMIPQQHYVMPSTAQYSSASMPPVSAPQYQPASPYVYANYTAAPSPAPLAAPFQPNQIERGHDKRSSQPSLSPAAADMAVSRSALHYHTASPPKSRSNSFSSTSQQNNNNCPTAAAKNITFNETYNPQDQIDFRTDVDQLMKSIAPNGIKEEDDQREPLTPVHTPKHEMDSPPSSTTLNIPKTKGGKKWVCNGPHCNKSFIQKTHLDIHLRTHTGARPYVRTWCRG